MEKIQTESALLSTGQHGCQNECSEDGDSFH
jgi:hypothetical protein